MKALKARLSRCNDDNNKIGKANGAKAAQDGQQKSDMRYSNLIVQLKDLENLNKIHSRHLDWLRSNLSLSRLPTLFSEIFDMPVSSKSSTSSVISESSEDEALAISISSRSDKDSVKTTETIVVNHNIDVDNSPNSKDDLIEGAVDNSSVASDTAKANGFELRDIGDGGKSTNIMSVCNSPKDRTGDDEHPSGNALLDQETNDQKATEAADGRQIYDCNWPSVVSQHHMSSEDLFFNDFGNLVDDSDDNIIDAANLNPTVHRLVATEQSNINPNPPD